MFFKSFSVTGLSLILAASSVFGQDNAITAPTAGQVIAAGSMFDIQWTPTNTTGLISLDLGTGPSANVQVVMNIATNIPNSGSFEWSVPDSVPAGTDYTIKISAGTDINFSGRFTITSSVTSTSSSSSTSTGPSSSSSSSTTTTLSGASASSAASGSAQSTTTAAKTSSLTVATDHAATAPPPSVSSMATTFSMSNFGAVFMVVAAILAGYMVIV